MFAEIRVIAVAAVLSVLIGCNEDPQEPDAGAMDTGRIQDSDLGTELQDAGHDAGVDAGEVDAGAPDTGIRRLMEYHVMPQGEATNLVIHPDFESRLINGGWIAYSLSPIQTQVPLLQRLIGTTTPSNRAEVAVVPGSDVVPMGLGSFAFATEQSFSASVWLGLDELAAPEGFGMLTAYVQAFEKEQGAVTVPLEAQPQSERVLDGVRWRRFEALAMGTFIGRLTVAYENLSPGPMYINAPRVFAVSASVQGGATNFERSTGPSFQRAVQREQVKPACRGLPEGVCGSL